jgi:hypothetical protein
MGLHHKAPPTKWLAIALLVITGSNIEFCGDLYWIIGATIHLIFYENVKVASCTKQNSIFYDYSNLHVVIFVPASRLSISFNMLHSFPHSGGQVQSFPSGIALTRPCLLLYLPYIAYDSGGFRVCQSTRFNKEVAYEKEYPVDRVFLHSY